MAKAITLKKALLVIGITAVLGMAYALYQWYKPARDVKDEDGIPVTATTLVDEFRQNEFEAKNKYQDQAIQVTGVVSVIKANQEGKIVVSMEGSSAGFGVQCTMKDKVDLKVGEKVTIKGICTGYQSVQMMDINTGDVVLIDCVIMNE